MMSSWGRLGGEEKVYFQVSSLQTEGKEEKKSIFERLLLSSTNLHLSHSIGKL